MRYLVLLYVVVLGCLLSSCAPEVKAPERGGRVERIISLGPIITSELYLLGVDDCLIANTVYCKEPVAAENKTKIGDMIQINIEKIVSLRPDLVIATGLTHPEQIQKLRNMGIRVERMPKSESFSMICEHIIKLGELVGKRGEAERIVEEVERGVEDVKKRVEGSPKKRVFIQIGTKPLFAVTGNSFINDFIRFGGGENIAEHEASGIYSREKVIKEDPDVIIIATMGIVAEEEKKVWGNYSTLKAVKNNNIHIVDSYKLCSPSPRIFVETLNEIVGILHPDLSVSP
ncbi:MAG: ABC transporter substrate-binding protein [Kiritimatiellae bacterium]|nr:ABC transporter substrate-binding protein [Kiritimatiellia bacterium]